MRLPSLPCRSLPCRLVVRSIQFAAALFIAAGCAVSPSDPLGEISPTGFSLVLLLAGEGAATEDQGEASSQELSRKHFAFMEELAAEGKLLLAGPFGPDKHDEALRGIFIIDESDPERARELAGEDPTTKGGMFRQEVIPIITLNVIRLLPEVEQLRQERRFASGESLDRPDVRAYTILMAAEGEKAAEEVFSNPVIGETVLLMARMGAPRENELFAILDVPHAAEARARLKVANTSGLEISVSEWYSSPALAELAGH